MTTKKEIFSLEEIKKHNSTNSCYIIVNYKVYDITSFLNHHPGGKNTILSKLKDLHDCTDCYNDHSDLAKKIWNDLYIGEVDDSGKNVLRDKRNRGCCKIC